MAKKGLGRGLGSLMNGESYNPNINEDEDQQEHIEEHEGNVKIRKSKSNDSLIPTSIPSTTNKKNILELDINAVYPNKNQPRRNFNDEELDELAESINKHGLLQPIIVFETEYGKYEIIAGERRWRASKRANKDTIFAIVEEDVEDKKLELALIENIQREDLNPMEEAYSYKQLIEQQGITQSELANLLSKGRSTITNSLRLLELPEQAQKLLYKGEITAGHARAILSVNNREGKEKLTNKIMSDKITVREAERLANLLKTKTKALTTAKPPTPKTYKKVAFAFKEYFGNPVKIKKSGSKNFINIEFKDEEDLKRLTNMILKNDSSS